MGCSSANLVREDTKLKQQNIYLNIDAKFHKNELIHAQSLINLISRIRNKIIYCYHKLIYHTGACLFINPTIVHCFKTILYKISSEYEGKIENCKIEYIEDPPFLKVVEPLSLTKESNNLINELFNFIVELRSFKAIINQINKETPNLLYLINESKENISPENINNINKGIELFNDLIKLREEILYMYKFQVKEFVMKKEIYFIEINLIGEEAFKEKKTDIYEITLLKKNIVDENDKDYQMYKSIKEAKKNMEKIINQEFNDEILDSHESIIETQKEEL